MYTYILPFFKGLHSIKSIPFEQMVYITVIFLGQNMLEFLIGALIGVWAAQQFTLPSVQQSIHTWWNKPAVVATVEEEAPPQEPPFSGPMPEI